MSGPTTTSDGDRPAVKEYPPRGHLLRRLAISLLPDDSDNRVLYSSLPLVPALFVDGRYRLSAIATMVDVAAGIMSVGITQPDWTATFDMASHRVGEAEPGSVADAVTRLVRAGKNIVVSETTVSSGGRTIAYVETTYSRLPHREGTPAAVGADKPRHLGQGEEPFGAPLADIIGFRRGVAGVVELDLAPLIRNSTGSIQGGASAMAMEEAALHLAGPGSALEFLHVYYLAADRNGPYRATATALRTVEHSTTGRVDLRGSERVGCQGTFIAGR